MKNLLLFIILLACAVGAAYGQARTAAQIETAPFSQLTTSPPDSSVRICLNCQANASTGYCESGSSQMQATKLSGHWKCTKFDPGSASGVSSFKGRSGAVTPTTDDYTFAQIGTKPTTLTGYGITDGARTALSNLTSVAINTTLVSDTNNTDDLGTSGIKWRTGYFGTSVISPNITFTTSVFDSAGTGSPNGSVTANIGSTYRRTDGGAATTLYVKESGNGTNTGWVAAGTGSGSVTSVATAGPIGGGTITTTGTITCATCVTSAASLTSTALMTGAGTQGSQTPSATTTLDSSGNFATPGGASFGVGSGTAANIGFGAGTATAVVANTAQIQAPTSVTGYNLVLPTAAGNGLIQGSNSANVVTQSFAPSGTSALGTGAISSGTCATTVTTSAPGTLTTDVILWGFNSSPTGVTGYTPSSSGMLTIIAYPSADNVNFAVCNNLAGSVTPGAITLNWRTIH